jgi:limonene-1,2-epoxide hydrolase
MVQQSLTWAKPRAFDFHHLAVEGDVVFCDWTISVERRADGGVVEWRGMSVAELRDGRIVWWREYYEDPAALARAARG